MTSGAAKKKRAAKRAEWRDSGEKRCGEEGCGGGSIASGRENGEEREAEGSDRFHAGEGPVAEVRVGYDEDQNGGGEERCVRAWWEERVGEASGEGVAASKSE